MWARCVKKILNMFLAYIDNMYPSLCKHPSIDNQEQFDLLLLSEVFISLM